MPSVDILGLSSIGYDVTLTAGCLVAAELALRALQVQDPNFSHQVVHMIKKHRLTSADVDGIDAFVGAKSGGELLPIVASLGQTGHNTEARNLLTRCNEVSKSETVAITTIKEIKTQWTTQSTGVDEDGNVVMQSSHTIPASLGLVIEYLALANQAAGFETLTHACADLAAWVKEVFVHLPELEEGSFEALNSNPDLSSVVRRSQLPSRVTPALHLRSQRRPKPSTLLRERVERAIMAEGGSGSPHRLQTSLTSPSRAKGAEKDAEERAVELTARADQCLSPWDSYLTFLDALRRTDMDTALQELHRMFDLASPSSVGPGGAKGPHSAAGQGANIANAAGRSGGATGNALVGGSGPGTGGVGMLPSGGMLGSKPNPRLLLNPATVLSTASHAQATIHYALLAMALAFSAFGLPTQAEQYIREAVRASQDVGDEAALSRALLWLGSLSPDTGVRARMLQRFLERASESESVGFAHPRDLAVEAHVMAADASLLRGERSEAYATVTVRASVEAVSTVRDGDAIFLAQASRWRHWRLGYGGEAVSQALLQASLTTLYHRRKDGVNPAVALMASLERVYDGFAGADFLRAFALLRRLSERFPEAEPALAEPWCECLTRLTVRALCLRGETEEARSFLATAVTQRSIGGFGLSLSAGGGDVLWQLAAEIEFWDGQYAEASEILDRLLQRSHGGGDSNEPTGGEAMKTTRESMNPLQQCGLLAMQAEILSHTEAHVAGLDVVRRGLSIAEGRALEALVPGLHVAEARIHARLGNRKEAQALLDLATPRLLACDDHLSHGEIWMLHADLGIMHLAEIVHGQGGDHNRETLIDDVLEYIESARQSFVAMQAVPRLFALELLAERLADVCDTDPRISETLRSFQALVERMGLQPSTEVADLMEAFPTNIGNIFIALYPQMREDWQRLT
eukprot:Clim_evm29s218 gene=Clim_evmTU29s218